MKLSSIIVTITSAATSALAQSQGILPTTSPTASPVASPAAPLDYPVFQSINGNCSSGYTYCGFILQELHSFTDQDLVTAYCASGVCPQDGSISVDQARHGLYLCRGNSADQIWSPKIQLLCGCRSQCFNVSPDFRAHCSSVCISQT